MTDNSDFLQIDTPENVVFGYEVAGLGSRFISSLIDTIILASIIIVTLIVLFAIIDVDAFDTNILIAIVFILNFLFIWGYFIVFELIWNGQTPGKRRSKLRVVRKDGSPVSASEIVVRNLVRIVDLLPGMYGVGVIAMFADKLSRRLGDIAAGTVVIHDKGAISLESLAPAPHAVNRTSRPMYNPDAPFPVHLLSEDDIQLAETYLARRHQISVDTIAFKLSRSLQRKMEDAEVSLQSRHDAEQFLHSVVSLYREAQGQ